MKAFHNDPKIKEALITQLTAHYLADEIIQGVYWENGKGCAVGCSIHSGRHQEYEPRFGIPQVLARLEDRIFELLDNASAKEWPIQFTKAIPVGADLSKIWPKFAAWLLTDEKYGVIQYVETPEEKSAIQQVSDLYACDREVTAEEWVAASTAADAAYAAAYAYAAASRAAYASYAAYAAASSAAYAAKATDADAAYASSAAAAYAAKATDASTAKATAKAYRKAQRDKLLELLENAPVETELIEITNDNMSIILDDHLQQNKSRVVDQDMVPATHNYRRLM